MTSREFRIEELHTPPGFEVSVYTNVPGGPRLMAFGPDGVLYVAARGSGAIVAVRGPNQVSTVLSGLNGPHSIAFHDGDMYVAVNDAVLRVRNGTPQRIVSLPSGGGHSTRTAAFGPDGRLYVTAGSTCNFCRESDPRRAAMMRYEADGSGEIVIAHGLRNPVGFAWHPETGELWATDNGGDGLGDDEPPEEIDRIREGADYGWPDCAGDRRPVEWGVEASPERCVGTEPPLVEMQAHSAPLGISFYTGAQFPASYIDDALVAFHGSWNRNVPTGYKVVRIHGGKVEDLLWGFLDPAARTMSGRPVDAIPGPAGDLFVSDDATGNIYHMVYTGPRISPGGLVDRGDRIYELYGTNLGGDPGTVTLTANGVPADVLYAGATQINFRLPELLAGDITIAVTNAKATDTILLHRGE